MLLVGRKILEYYSGVSFKMLEAVSEMTRTTDISVGSGKKNRPERRWTWGGYGTAELKRFQWLMGWIGLLTLLPLRRKDRREQETYG